jgi:deoxyribodipyrimidine photo-lyase
VVNERIRKLNSLEEHCGGKYVAYRLRHNRRIESNHALAYAVETANRLDLPLLVIETLPDDELRRNFVSQGAGELAAGLRKLGAGYSSDPGLLQDAAAVVTDDFPAIPGDPEEHYDVAAYAVDSSCIVPWSLIEGQAYAAYSIRPKIQRLLPRFLVPAPPVQPVRRTSSHVPSRTAGRVRPTGGRSEAGRRLDIFLRDRLHRYAREKNEPSKHATSDLSPYLHFGYISSLEVALAVREYADTHKLFADEFLEELIVRRELAFNFARYAKRMDTIEALPEWARNTLNKHRQDRRDPLYTAHQFETAATHDDLWNATQKELLLRGKIHGYYRMYWGKKIVEWSATPEEALAAMIRLHDRYALDGRDPNTYANILWCFGLHDRPWGERPIFGTVRWMSRAGMDRKTDTAAYIREIECLERTGKEMNS